MHRLDFSQLKILVVGDSMIDRYLEGGISRRSPEADAPIFAKKAETSHLGGAANVALNLISLGASCILLTITGDDSHALQMEELMSDFPKIKHYAIKDSSRKTTVKTRIISDGVHLLRVDSEDTHDINETITLKIKKALDNIIKEQNPDGIILQDYNKGLLTKELIGYIMKTAKSNNIPTFIDPKFKHFSEYQAATVFKPNKKELEASIGKPLTINDLIAKSYLEDFRNKIGCEVLMVTLSEDGLIYVTENQKIHIPTIPRAISDVCGAGDTVISTIALGYIARFPLFELGKLANIAGGQVCESTGVVTVDLKKLIKEYKELATP
jgi:rfaE bifunctional protein kinase chain/domain